MTLLHRITLRISVVVAVLLTGWAFLFYFAITDEINDETDDSLEHYAEILIERALAGESLPATTNGSNNQYYLERISEEMAQITPGICYGDTMIYIWDKKETEPARFYSAIFRDDDGQYYNLRVFTPTFEKEDLIQSILLLIIILYSALLIAIIVVNMIVFYRSMKPFYRVIRWLDAYRPGGRTSELKNDTNISEFRKLNEAAVNYTKRMAIEFIIVYLFHNLYFMI